MSVRGSYIGPGVPKAPPVPPKRKNATNITTITISGGKENIVGIVDCTSLNTNNNSCNSRTQHHNGIPAHVGVVGGDANGKIPNGHHPGATHVNGLTDCTNGDCGVTDGVEDHSFHRFASDVRNPESCTPARIYGNRGSIRGHKNRVRAGIAVLTDKSEGTKNYRDLEKGRIVIFTTSIQIIRETYERCKRAIKILQTHIVEFEERDVFLSSQNQNDLKERLKIDKVVVPQVFVDGQHLGGANELEELNESGQLRVMFTQFKKISKPTKCNKCGGYMFIPCTLCNGSKKSLRRNNFTNTFSAMRCISCDENGLIRCDLCVSQQN